MPLPGDQHRDTPATTNPFATIVPRVNQYTAQEIATLQSRLDKQLGPEYISTRPGAGGGKVHYLAAEKVINLANEVFGFNGWSSAIQNVQVDFVDENTQTGKITLGLSTIVRVTLRDGSYHEDIGYGHIENCKGKAPAFEKAKKEAATDALKRALRNFGNVLGNCLYDKEYLQKVTRIRLAPSRWDEDNLHRHVDYAPVKHARGENGVERKHPVAHTRQLTTEQSDGPYGSGGFEEDFGGNMFDDTDFTNPDEIHLKDNISADSPAQRAISKQQPALSRIASMPQLRPPNAQPSDPPTNGNTPQKAQAQPRPPTTADHAMVKQQQRATTEHDSAQTNARPGATNAPHDHLNQAEAPISFTNTSTVGAKDDGWNPPPPKEPPPGIPDGFITGRAAEMLERPSDLRPPNAALAFNPHFESTSIRRTQGVNPGKSVPIKLNALNRQAPHAPPMPNGNTNGTAVSNTIQSPNSHARTNFVNPSADPNRKLGMPPAAGLQNRTSYKPPTALKRPALVDVSNVQQDDSGGDAKRARVETPPPAPAANPPAAGTTGINA